MSAAHVGPHSSFHRDALRAPLVVVIIGRVRPAGVDLLEKGTETGDDLDGGLHEMDPGALHPATGGVAQLVEILRIVALVIHLAPRIAPTTRLR